MADLTAKPYYAAEPANIERLPLPFWLVWAVLAGFFLLVNLPDVLAHQSPESDDYLRLQQIRDLLGGQAWFDSRQYRMDPPYGADIHWVRLVDLPVAGFILLFRLVFSPSTAELLAMIAVPLAQLALALAIIRGMCRDLALDGRETLAAMVALPLMPLLIYTFMPMRIDHHGWQTISVVFAFWMLLRGGYRRAALGGAACAVSLFISLEAMLMVATLGGLYSLRYIDDGRREHEGFLLGLTGFSLLLTPVLRPASDFALPYCDMLSWPHLLAFAGVSAMALLQRILPGQSRPLGRSVSFVLFPLVAVPAMMLPLGICAVTPMSVLDPVLRKYWFENLVESAPIWRQYPSMVGMLLSTPLILAAGCWLAFKKYRGSDVAEGWSMLALAALAAWLVSLLVLRGAITSQILLLPFSGLIIAELLPRARAIGKAVPRALATVMAFLIATPAPASAMFKLFDARMNYTLVQHPDLGTDGMCDLDDLDKLPLSHLFASLDAGAQIISRTPHSVVMGGYHRNQKKMLEIFRAFGGPLDEARGIIDANHADYLVTCTSSPDLAAYANMGTDNLADRIFARQVPDWLEEIPMAGDPALRVYRIRRQAALKSSATPLMQ